MNFQTRGCEWLRRLREGKRGGPQAFVGRWQVLLALAALPWLVGCREVIVEKIPAPAQTGERSSYADAVSNVAPCVVSVATKIDLSNKSPEALSQDPALRQFLEKESEHVPHHLPHHLEGLGSGVVISPQGYILTSGHVVENADEITVTMAGGEKYKARVIGTDAPTDVAVLKIEARNLPVATLADSRRLRVGDVVLAVGNPFGVGQTVTSGIVSATERSDLGLTDYEDFIQTDASINPGNSGGALTDARGRVVGINTAILSHGGGFEGIGLAVPINIARNVMQQIMTQGKVVRGYLGVGLRSLTPELAKANHLPASKGAIVSAIEPNSPADRAGLREGDIILRLNGNLVENSRDLRLRIAQIAPGTHVKLKIQRAAGQKLMSATLGELPHEQEPDEHPRRA